MSRSDKLNFGAFSCGAPTLLTEIQLQLTIGAISSPRSEFRNAGVESERRDAGADEGGGGAFLSFRRNYSYELSRVGERKGGRKESC